jgi:hypothetical protein
MKQYEFQCNDCGTPIASPGLCARCRRQMQELDWSEKEKREKEEK